MSEPGAGPRFVGVDVGGTNIKIGIVDDLGQRLAFGQIATKQELGPEDAMQRVAAEIERIRAEKGLDSSSLVAVGLATPGTMDIANGTLLQPHNLRKWWNYPIRDCLRDACGRAVWFANDANAAAFGEHWVGSGSAYQSIALFTLGTGVGGGIILGDLSIDGENSAGGELGHTIIDWNETARLCGCGQRGHLEAYASAKAVIQRAEECLAGQPRTSLLARRQREGEITPLMIAQEAEAGDAVALELVMDTAKYLGIGATNVMHIVDPGAVVFGGAMTFGGPSSELGRRFLERIRQEVRERAFPVLAERTAIEFASLGSDAGWIGAAAIARAGYRKRN
jgi:glucokinase